MYDAHDIAHFAIEYGARLHEWPAVWVLPSGNTVFYDNKAKYMEQMAHQMLVSTGWGWVESVHLVPGAMVRLPAQETGGKGPGTGIVAYVIERGKRGPDPKHPRGTLSYRWFGSVMPMSRIGDREIEFGIITRHGIERHFDVVESPCAVYACVRTLKMLVGYRLQIEVPVCA